MHFRKREESQPQRMTQTSFWAAVPSLLRGKRYTITATYPTCRLSQARPCVEALNILSAITGVRGFGSAVSSDSSQLVSVLLMSWGTHECLISGQKRHAPVVHV